LLLKHKKQEKSKIACHIGSGIQDEKMFGSGSGIQDEKMIRSGSEIQDEEMIRSGSEIQDLG
jgi:hypothetical protein